MRNVFRYFNSSSEVIRLTVMMYIRYPLSLRQVDLLHLHLVGQHAHPADWLLELG
jgi:transposase-like protein